jgi:N-hydroxyarylamine O-acetyltransferase
MSDWATRYLHVLELELASPTLDLLERLCRAQVTRVPFENVTAILRRRAAADGPVATLDSNAMLAAWEARAGGGVCVDAAPTFRRLLEVLGYTVRPVLAQISFPGSHQASIVDLDGRAYLVDVANGAPFFEPIPLDEATVLRRAGLAWRFHRDGASMLVQDREIAGEWTPFCYYTLRAASSDEIEAAYQRHHTPGVSWVVGNLTLVRCTETEVVRLRDDELARYSAAGSSSELVKADSLPALADQTFDLPALPILEAAAALRSSHASVSAQR